MAFWGESLSATAQDPKRKFRFKVMFGKENQVVWWAKTVEKPKLTVEATEHKFMGHTFKYPGSVKWENINLTLVDPLSPDAAAETLKILSEAGYVFPESGYVDNSEKAMTTMNKAKAVDALGTFKIVQLDAEGKAVESWTLHNPFVVDLAFGDLSYEAEDLSEITMGIAYDWAAFKLGDSYEFKLP